MGHSGYYRIPANIITGFLGVGKTSAIQWLLQHKPDAETWAVLVNEFGEVGIDGALLRARGGGERRVHIRELPGGCMCCSAGVPFQTALNQLLKQSRPDRLLIEPTGLGHPHELIGMLGSGYYAEIIDLQATLTLVDARKIAERRYRDHEIFRQQVQVADRIVSNKRDLYGDDEARQLRAFLQELGLGRVPLDFVEQGRLQSDWLREPRMSTASVGHEHQRYGRLFAEPVTLPACGYVRVDNCGEGYNSSGWIFAPRFRFDFMRIYQLLSAMDAERAKAVLRTERGWVAFNMADGVLTHSPLQDAGDSRLELISSVPGGEQDFEQSLMRTIADR